MTGPLIIELHATGVAIGGMGVALLGQSGSGKSDLALRLIDRGAILICDDRIRLFEAAGSLNIGGYDSIAGKLEVRGIGICTMPFVDQAPLKLIVDLDTPPDRYPDPPPVRTFNGHDVPELRLNAFEASAPLRIELALRRVLDPTKEIVRQGDETR